MKRKIYFLTAAMPIALLVLSVILITACGKDDDNDNNNPPDSPDPLVDEYLAELPPWEDFCPLMENKDVEFPSEQELNCDDKYALTTTPCSITRTPEDIVTYDQASEIIFLGSLIQGDGYMDGPGSIQQLPIYQRAPLSITISFSTADNTRVVENPSLTTVNQAIGELVDAAQSAGHVAGSSISFNQITTHSVEHTALALGLSAKYMSAKVKGDLAWESTAESTTISAYFIQKMFTTSMELPQRPMDLFSNEFTQEILDEQVAMGRIGPGNLPVYVSSIVWGRMMLLTMTSTFDETRMKAALSASYAGIGGAISAEHLETLQQSNIQLVTVGGSQETALGLLESGNLGEYFKYDAPLTTAVPISYTLRCLSDNKVAKMSEVTDYNRTEYAPITVTYYDSEAAWRDEAQAAGLELLDWEWDYSSIFLCNEYEGFIIGSSDQIAMGSSLYYPQGLTSLPFDFYLKNLSAPGNDWALVFNEPAVFPGGNVSIGHTSSLEDDDFEVGFSGTNVYALGINLVGNDDLAGEYFEAYATDGQQECYIDQVSQEFSGYLGIMSPVPLKRMWFNEDAGGDDIAVGKFTFGVKQN